MQFCRVRLNCTAYPVNGMTMKTIWTIGHSNRPMAEFVLMLQSFEILNLADVRRFPGSRRQPQFAQETLRDALATEGITYHHLEQLGGRRNKRSPDSQNDAWRVESFNAYADYMQTQAFQAALCQLEELAVSKPTAMMCAEAVPWRCHRRLIADALTVKGWTVRDIFAPHRDKVHPLTRFAQVDDEKISYPAALPEEERKS